MNTGARAFKCGVSSIDTSMLMCGVLTCGEYFKGTAIAELAGRIYGRINGGGEQKAAAKTAIPARCGSCPRSSEEPRTSTPACRATSYRYTFYCGLMMLYLLGLGSPTHPLPAAAWHAWKRPIYHYHGLPYIHSSVPIYGDQYSHAWFDFRGKRDACANYFQSSVTAARAHKIFCLGLKPRFPDYSQKLWGTISSHSLKGYVNWRRPAGAMVTLKLSAGEGHERRKRWRL